jgi:hypothetical protein
VYPRVMRGEHIPFEEVPLEKEQKDLLADMVEAERAVAPHERRAFLLIGSHGGDSLNHPGLRREAVYPGDLRELAHWGLLRINYTSQGNEQFDVTGNGRQYYAWMKQQEGEPVEQVEAEVRRFLQAENFRHLHGRAYERWAEAEAALWEAETTPQFTDLGHACREAIQLFVTDLVEQHQPPDVNPDLQKTVDRLRAVMGTVDLSDAVDEFAAALLAYFGTVSDLVQRQEHGALKEGEALKWEDARRVVFQTAMVMFELDRVLG